MPGIKISNIIVLIIFYCILASAGASMTIGTNAYIDFMAAVLCWGYFTSRRMIKTNRVVNFAALLLIAASAYTGHGGKLYDYLIPVLRASLAVVILSLAWDVRVYLLHKLSRWFGVLLTISILLWLVHLVIPLPHVSSLSDVWWNESGMVENNYFFFMESAYFESGADSMQRFQGMFMEPGHLGTICALFLICNKFDFSRRENWVFLIALLMSVSSAAYILLVLGWLFLNWSRKRLRYYLPAVLGVLAVILFFSYFRGGDNVVNNMIFSKIAGEGGPVQRRVSPMIYETFLNMWSTGQDLAFGKTAMLLTEMEDMFIGAGAIVYFVLHGIVGTALIILAYFFIYKSCKSRYGLMVFIIYMITFLQRSYLDWDAFSLPFIMGLPLFRDEKNNGLYYNI